MVVLNALIVIDLWKIFGAYKFMLHLILDKNYHFKQLPRLSKDNRYAVLSL